MPPILIDIFRVAILIYSVVLHEVSHGLVARALGDHTAEEQGRLTLNPLKHLDLFGSFILPIVTRLSFGFMFGYAKPVPYDPYALSDRRYGAAKVAIAGPMANLLLAVLFGLVLRWFGPAMAPLAVELLASAVLINLVIASFNLMPIPPLDGHWLLITFLSPRFDILRVALSRYQWIILLFFIFFVFPLFWPLLAAAFRFLTGIPIQL